MLQGFLRAWRDSGLCDRVVGRIRELVAALEHNGGSVRVLVTGGCCLGLAPRVHRRVDATDVMAAPGACAFGHGRAAKEKKDVNRYGDVAAAGHSLGGALATLAAFDIQEACNTLPQMSLSVRSVRHRARRPL